ncbi:hypothetical protein, partial [Geobacter sp. OR-1]|uniref:hypothetical protein n=1 Tax=Geobacter sp. OR-1 TaxID=1266765 RepID=UPI001ED9AD9A
DGLRVANSARETIVSAIESGKCNGKSIFIVAKDRYVKDWYFQGNKFFRFYTGENGINISYANSYSDLPANIKSYGDYVVFVLDESTRKFSTLIL